MKKLLIILFAACAVVMPAIANTKQVNGTVVDAQTGDPLAGATVIPVGGKNGVATDLDGNFTFEVPASTKQLRISYIGYVAKLVPAGRDLKIALEQDGAMLDDLVITGYGTGKKIGSVVGAVSVVGEKQFEKVTTANFTDALAGQVSGLSVLTSSGDPSKSASIRLRGVNSIEAGTTPLFILDGAPVSSAVFNTLNPADIENISVLKDAASTSIYGSRAANGVIVITTKKGKYGQNAKVTLRAQYGFSSMVSDAAQMMNSKQYVEFRDLIGQPVSDEIRKVVNDYGIDTNWRKEIFTSNAPTYTVEAAVQGGSQNSSYYISVNHHSQEGIIAQSGMRREAIRFNFDTRVNSWFKLGFQSNLGYTKYEQNNEIESSSIYTTNPAYFARKAFPFDSPRYYTIENGKPVFGEKAMYLKYTGAPTPEYIQKGRSVKRSQVNANVNLYEAITPIKGLTIRAQQAVDAFEYRLNNEVFPLDDLITPMGSKYNGRTGAAQKSSQLYYAWTYTNTAEYKFDINHEHNFSFLLGQESIISKSTTLGAYASGHTDKRLMAITSGSTISISDITDSKTETVSNSYFFNMGYNFDEKYFFDATVRRDGSSKFAPKHRWGTFWSLGARWNLKKEAFLDGVSWLDDLSLQVSYGTTGNSSIGNYMFYGLLGNGGNYNGASSIGISQASNEDLTWETVGQFDLGITVGLFDHIQANIDVYKKNTTNMLMDIPYSYTTGFSGGYGNIGSMSNTGIDVDFKFNIFKKRDFFWDVKINFNYNKDEITKLFNGRDTYTLSDYGLQYKVGHSSGEFYQVRWVGVDPRDGKQLWLTKEGNLTKTFNEERDAVLVGKSLYAPWNGGFGTELGYKGFQIGADFTWQAKKYLYNNDNYFIENTNQATSVNQTVKMLNVWTTPGQVTDVPAYGEALQFDDHMLEDASFIRLKKLAIQYSLPKSVLSKIKMERVNLFFVGRNLWTITKYSGFDPEPDTNLVHFNYPNTRQYVFGLEVTF